MKIEIAHKTSLAKGTFGTAAAQLALRLEGRKKWNGVSALSFETSQHNISLLLSLFPSAEIEDKRTVAVDVFDVKETLSGDPVPEFVMEPRDFQLENFERFKNMLQWAIFSEQGTGKTKVAIDIICHRFKRGSVTGVIVFSSPKGVHAQWIEEQFPKHIWPSVKALTYIWEGKKPPVWLGKVTPELQVLSGNIDMLKSGKAFAILEAFASHHRERLLILVDESDSIRNFNSQRSIKLRDLVDIAGTQQRAVMTGTPIAKDLTDEWAQFYFLNSDILGHKYLVSFRAQYCIMGGEDNREVVGHQNVDNFKRIVAPYIFRATKKDLNLPEKVYDEVVFDLEPEQKQHIKTIREEFFAQLEKGELNIKNGAGALLRIQQISNGFAINDDKQVVRLKANPRLKALQQLRRDLESKVIIWCRFQEDVRIVAEQFPGAVTYYGVSDSEERTAAKRNFIEGNATEFIATPGAAGKGIDGLQRVCSTAVYYSNSYNAIDRWQSEDRIDRIGLKGTSTYFDLIGRGSTDRSILRNLKKKKDISSMALDDIVSIMEEI